LVRNRRGTGGFLFKHAKLRVWSTGDWRIASAFRQQRQPESDAAKDIFGGVQGGLLESASEIQSNMGWMLR
jgi:hypothetical protein